MGKYRGGPKPWENEDSDGRRLDPGQYPEMNAVFYSADPVGFIKMRIESLSLMAASDELLAPLFAAVELLERRSSIRHFPLRWTPGDDISDLNR
jgi:hypothetical protein